MAPEFSGYQARMDRYGPPEVLVWTPVSLAPLATTELRIRTLAAAVNHTDVEVRAGAWPIRKARPFPYVPGVEVVGLVVAVGPSQSDSWIGQTVITMMQGMGGVRAERAGGYATYVTVEAEAVARVPDGVDPLALAALGLAGVTAYHGLQRLGDLQGRDVLVTGAAGGVGSAAVSIASAAGARVTGLITGSKQEDYVRRLGARSVIVNARHTPPVLAVASVDGVLDAVGGEVFGACAAALRPNGVLCLVGAVNGGPVSFDAWSLILPTCLTGYSTETLDGESLRQTIAALCAGLAGGRIRAPDYQVLPLSQAAEAHRRMEAGGLSGRLLLVPDPAEAG